MKFKLSTWYNNKLKTGPEDGTHVPKHVIVNSTLHLLEVELCFQEYNKYCL
jgi:hypothetical protein